MLFSYSQFFKWLQVLGRFQGVFSGLFVSYHPGRSRVKSFHSPAKASTAQKTPLGEHQGLEFPVKIFQVAIKAKLDRLVLNVTTRKRLEAGMLAGPQPH
jgi:hypothetical protein